MVLRAAPLAPAKGADGATRSFLTSPWAACDQNFWTPIVVMSHAGRSFDVHHPLRRKPAFVIIGNALASTGCRPRVVPNGDGSTARSSGARARRQFLKDQVTNDQGLIHGPTSGQSDAELSWTMRPCCSALSAAPHASTIENATLLATARAGIESFE
jgi:hypothetical protein